MKRSKSHGASARAPTASPAVRSAPGLVVFIGAGPGAADLVTLRGARWLAQADVVLFDALTDEDFRFLAPDARWVDVGKRGFSSAEGAAGSASCHAQGQASINARIVLEAQRAKVVVRLKGGDPSLFGRLEEELQAVIEAGLQCEVVPGVTAALAAAAQCQRPLTRRGRGRSVTLSTAMSASGLIDQGTARADTEVFYMAGKQLPALARRLLKAQWPAHTPVMVVSRAGCADAMCTQVSLANLAPCAALHAGRPSIVTVGAGAQAVHDKAPVNPVRFALTQESPHLETHPVQDAS